MSIKFALLLTSSLALLLSFYLRNLLTLKYDLPDISDKLWSCNQTNDSAIYEFKINISDKELDDLHYRLRQHRDLTKPLEGTIQNYGFNTDTLEEIVDHWKNKYNWREREQFLNKYPQFKTRIQGLNIHFLRIKPKATKTIPLLVLHGWASSFREFFDVIPELTSPKTGNDFVFEVIVPSLPGFGFSDPATKPGLSVSQIAVIMKNLMIRLGHNQFYVQGGDWGAAISTLMASLFPKHVLGIHCNLCLVSSPFAALKHIVGSLYPPLVVDQKNQHKLYPLTKFISNLLEEYGYFHIQATKPDTIGVALNDSPIGLASYLLEKWSTLTNPNFKMRKDAGLASRFNYDDLLDNIMIYWFSRTITTSMRIYKESFSWEEATVSEIPIKVPSACTKFEHEIIYLPDWILRDKYKNLVFSKEHDDGGHFPGLELPQVLAEDVWEAIGIMEKMRS